MKLYVTYGSPYARLARIIVIEKALEHRVEIIEAKTRTPGSPYYQINPSGRVPYLVDDSGVGTEDSQLICAYLDNLDGKPRFHDARRQMDWGYQRFEFAARNMCEGICVWIREMARPAGERSPTALAHEVARAQRMADVFEDRIADPLMQGPLNMAHLILAVALDVAAKRGFGDLAIGRPQLTAWMRSMSELPSMQRTAPASSRQLRGGEMRTQPRISPKTIETLADAVYPSFALLAGMELDLFTPLKDGPLTAEEIARAAGTDRAKTAPLLHALVAIGLLKSDGDRFLNSPEADQFLVRGSPDYIGMRHHAYRRRWNSALCVAETIRAGVPQRRMDYASMPADARESFYRGTFTECLAAGRVLARSRDFSHFHSLVDVGGGSGGLAIAMAETWPNLTITIADLPAITPVAQRYVDEAGFATRIKVCPTNVVSDPLSGSYDVAMMRGLFPVLTGDQIRKALANVYSVLKPGSPIYVVGWILDDSRTTPLAYATYNLLFVNDYADGLIHTEAEHRTWLEEAGFEYVLREPSAPSYAADFIVARKPAA